LLALSCGLVLLASASRAQDVEPGDETAPAAAPETPEPGDAGDSDAPATQEPQEMAPTPGIEQLVVTANRREEQIQDVPISLAVLSAETLDITGTYDFLRIQNFVPNLRILPITDSRSTSIRIRGIGSTGTNAGVDPSVGVFIDGVYQGRAGMSVSDLLDVERVEVLRGPQGTLYGKNTAAGAINVISRRPSYDFEAIVEGVYGNYNDRQARGSLNVPLVANRLAARLSGYIVRRDGYDTNRFDGSRVNDANKYGAKGRFLLEISDRLDFLLTADYSKEDANCCYADIITYQGPPSLPIIGATFNDLAAAEPAGSRFSTLPEPEDPFDRIIGANDETSNRVVIGGVAGELDYEIGDHMLTWLNAWRRYESDSHFDGDFSVYDGVFAFTRTELDQFSSELRVTSPGGGRFDYQGGLFFYYQTQDTLERNGLEQGYMDASTLGILTGGEPLVNIGENTHETLSGAIFADGSFYATEQWSLTLGIRGTYEHKTRVGTQTSNFTAIDVPPLLGPDVDKDEERSVGNASGRAILRYSPDFLEGSMAYASFSSGFKSGGFNQLRTREDVPSEFDDELSLNYEGGVRTGWLDQRLMFNFTAFYTDYQDFQAQSFDGTSISIRNAASVESYGFETDVLALPRR
jgi:iron complex outermembrane receptor protein